MQTLGSRVLSLSFSPALGCGAVAGSTPPGSAAAVVRSCVTGSCELETGVGLQTIITTGKLSSPATTPQQ